MRKSASRRSLLIGLLLLPFAVESVRKMLGDDFIIVNGWVLKRQDVDRDAI
jgi:hypothetical protein